MNSTIPPPAGQPDWGKPQFKSHGWLEPIIVFSIMMGSMILNRRRGFRIRGRQSKDMSILDSSDSDASDDTLLCHDGVDDEGLDPYTTTNHPPKSRFCCGTVVHTPNSSRFANHWHSRTLQKFPFLVEMFYWALNFLFYVFTKPITEILFASEGTWDLAEAHGVKILQIEHESWASFLFPLREIDVQQFFMDGHQTTLTFLNRAYSLVHIPGTVSFIAWYYFVAPNHTTFATVRRTMTLANFLTFSIFTFFPCMPPRLLDEKYGFHDTVRHDDAQSIWASGKFFNQLAAFPSLHFAYAFSIGCTVIYHSGVFRRRLSRGETRKSKLWQAIYVVGGVAYPSLVLTVIVATANHYWLDATGAMVVVSTAFLCNRVFMVLLPLEDLFLWVMRLEKPVPTTGDRFNRREGKTLS